MAGKRINIRIVRTRTVFAESAGSASAPNCARSPRTRCPSTCHRREPPCSARRWMPILIVGVISATLAYRNLSLQQAGNRPDMIKRQEEFSTNVHVDVGQFFDALALCATFHDDEEEQFSDPMFDPNADVCCLILAELSDHRGKILRVVCHKPSSTWRSAMVNEANRTARRKEF